MFLIMNSYVYRPHLCQNSPVVLEWEPSAHWLDKNNWLRVGTPNSQNIILHAWSENKNGNNEL